MCIPPRQLFSALFLGLLLLVPFTHILSWISVNETARTAHTVPFDQPFDVLKTSFDCDIAIVGGGVAGLYAAVEAARRLNGCRHDEGPLSGAVPGADKICLFERLHRLGGRIFDIHLGGPEVEPVGFGAWRFDETHDRTRSLIDRYEIPTYPWPKSSGLFEARGVFTSDPDVLLSEAFPTLRESPIREKIRNVTFGMIRVLAEAYYAQRPPKKLDPDFSSSWTQLPSAFLTPSDLLTSIYGHESVPYFKASSGFSCLWSLPLSLDAFFEPDLFDKEPTETWKLSRPIGGMSAITKHLEQEAKMAGIRVITGAEVEAVSNESPQTLISRSSPLQYKLNVKILSNEEGASANAAVATIRAAKLIITAPPAAMERIHGDIMERIRAQPQFRASIPVKVFKSAAVYPHAWWEPALDPEKTYMTDSTCLGSITPYRGRGPNGEAVLHTSYAEGECADNYWASAMKYLNSTQMTGLIHQKVKSLFPHKANEIPDPIQVIYHLWDDGGWHLWALDSPSKISLQNWATSGPLTEEEVYLANEAWGIKRGWVQASLGAADEVLRHIFRERETQVGHMKVAKGHEKSVDVEKTSKEGEPVFAIQRAGGGVETEWTTRVDDEGSRSDISRDGVMWSEQKLESIALLPNLF